VTDGQIHVRSDRRTHDDGIYRASIASRDKNGPRYPVHAHYGYFVIPKLTLDITQLCTKFKPSQRCDWGLRNL